MAIVDDRDFEGFAPSSQAARMQWFVNMAGAVTSVALVLGVGVWGYKLAVRDVTGIPVVRALEGPMRVAPQEPGGEIVAHTGLSVNDVAAEGAAAPLPEQMVLAPRPIDLTEEDVPVAALAAASTPAAAPETTTLASLAVAAPSSTVSTSALVDPGLPPLAPGELTETPLATPPFETAALLSDPVASAPVEDALETSVDDALAEALGAAPEDLTALEPAPAGALRSSPRPARRPEGDGTAEVIVPASLTTEEVGAGGEVDVASLTAGTRMVQLGAFDDEAGARAEWASLQRRFGDLIAPKALVLQEAQSGGRSFVRLRALGFEDEADARRFCSALLAENATCIPVTHRP
jgi:hypothetical protein